MIDTHTHLSEPEFEDDLTEVVHRAKEAGVTTVLLPAINLESMAGILTLCRTYSGFAYPMIGLHPEEVKADYQEVLGKMKAMITPDAPYIAIGEVGLDYYWSREFEQEQLAVFEEQVKWSVETRLPLMIHCRKAQNEMVKILHRYEKDLPGGVFHCFTGNEKEAAELLAFDRFCLGIGGVLTFKKSNLPTTLREVPLERVVLETDAPYMAPVPMRGKRNESAFLVYVVNRLQEVYGKDAAEISRITTENVYRTFKKLSIKY
jgi:TatD DNase family protein